MKSVAPLTVYQRPAVAVLASFFLLIGPACSEKRFVVQGSPVTTVDPMNPPTVDRLSCSEAMNPSVPCFLLLDSFERNDPTGPGVGGDFSWRTLVDDRGALNGQGVHADIYDAQDFGPTPLAVTGTSNDLGRSLIFTGRAGSSVHDVYLISRDFNVSEFNSLNISLDFIGLGLEGWQWAGRSGQEGLRVEICRNGRDACGAGESLDPNSLNSNQWNTIYQSPANIGSGLTQSHGLVDWQNISLDVDLLDLSDEAREQFVFRIVVTMDNGFLNGHSIADGFDDGLALDNVVVTAN